MTPFFKRSKAKRSLFQRIVRLLAIFFVLLAIFLIALPWMMRGHIERRFAESLETRFDAEVRLDRFDLSWTGGVAIRGLVVQRDGEDEPFLEVARARFAPSLFAILGGTFHMEGTLAEDVVVRLVRENGKFPLIESFRESLQREPGEERETRDPRDGYEVNTDRMRLDLDVALEGVRVEVIDSSWPERSVYAIQEPIRLRSLSSVAVELTTQLIPELHTRLSLELVRDSRARLPRDLNALLEVRANGADLASLQPTLAPWVRELGGRMEGMGRYQLQAPGSLSGEGRWLLTDFAYQGREGDRSISYPEPQILEARLGGSTEDGEAIATWAAGATSGELRTEFGSERDLRFVASADLAAEELVPLLPPAATIDWEGSPMKLLAGASRGSEPGSWVLDASLETSGTTFYVGKDGHTVFGPGLLGFAGTWFGGEQPRLEGGSLSGPGVDVTLERADPHAVHGVAKVDLDEFAITWIEGFGVGVLASGPGEVRFGFDRPAEEEGRWSGSAALKADRLETDGFEVQGLSCTLDVNSEGGYAVRDGELGLNGGLATFSVELPWVPGEEARPFRVSAGLNDAHVLAAQTLDLARILPLLSGAGAQLQGSFGLDLELSGDASGKTRLAETLSGSGALRLDSTRLVPSSALAQPLTNLGVDLSLPIHSKRIPFEIAAGVVELPELRLGRGDLQLSLQGKTGIDGTLEHTLGVRFGGRSWERYAKLLDPEGYLRLPLRGSLEAPRLEVPNLSQLFKKTVEQTVQDGFRNGDWGRLFDLIRKEPKEKKPRKRKRKDRDGE